MHRIQRGSQPRRPSSHQAPVGGLAGGPPLGETTVAEVPAESEQPAMPTAASAAAAPGVTPSAPAAAPAAPTPSEAGAVAPDGGLCPTSRLTVRSADAEGAAGSTYEKLVLTNTGSATCLLRGFPGVSYVDAAGRQVGAPAVRTGPAGASARLAPGASATATLRTVHPGLQEGCEQTSQTTPVAALRIYPPANTTALRLPLSGVSACVNPAVQQLSVTTLTR
ncbi:conserved hypothetical protein [Frankia canadensis]|uniref:DUF4232 domain-containing protein n=1 Tax=Frankia canadensis TaxID=1836972 RepID=A0A2I2KR18_9ACTN|nr:DUF4232 domain-containing protein [Frankia canadensis]SNQ48102.1 conserved hypothetical protein [Frankia canadensis]SOU55392.1 conserved hypothetical protein [Frankia canadensis]